MIQIETKQHFSGHQGAIYALTPGTEQNIFYSVGGDGWLVQWTVGQENGRLLARHDVPFVSLATFQETIFAGSLHGQLFIYRPSQDPRLVDWHKKGLFKIIVCPPHLFTLGGDGRLTKWDLFKGLALETIRLSSQALRSAYQIGDSTLYIGASDGCIYQLQLPDLSVKAFWQAHRLSVFSLAFHDGILFSGGRDGMLKSWDLNDGQRLLHEVPAHLYTINALTMAGKYLVSASRDKTVKIWHVPTLELLKVIDIFKFEAHFRSVNQVLYLEADQLVLSAGDDRQIISWKIN